MTNPRIVKWWHGWAPLIVLPAAMVFVPSEWPRWVFMWLLAFAIFCGCKWLTWRRTPVRGVPIWRHVGYFVGWPGLDAVSFLDANGTKVPRKPTRSEWLFASAKTIVGCVILFGLARCVPIEYPYLTGWVGMIGIVMILHFGTFHLLSCAWRSIGVDAKPLMNWPLTARSLSDFWGRRWNTAFRDLTHRFLFRPMITNLGSIGAVCVGFVFSGLVHEVVISVPARGGYGGPTIFFLIQGAGMLVERSRRGRALGLGSGWRGWLFTMTLLLAPVVLLFHPRFVMEVVVPFMGAVGAIG